jgi:methionyl-tRNA formyltransferase
MDKHNLTIVFFGEDSFSNIVLISLIKAGYTVPLVVSPFYNNNIHKRLERTTTASNIEYVREKNINSEFVVQKVKNIKPDLLISVHFSKLIKKELIAIPLLGCLNLHPSLLPFYRGMAPQHWPIINGEKKTGITVHFIDEGIDTGNIVLQREITLTENMYVSDLQLLWTKEYQTIMHDAVKLVSPPPPPHFKGIIQDRTKGSYFGKLKLSQCEIKIEKGIRSAYNLIRGVSKPYYGAFVQIDVSQIIIIWRAEIISDKPEMAIGRAVIKNDKLYFSFFDGTLLITKYEFKPIYGGNNRI